MGHDPNGTNRSGTIGLVLIMYILDETVRVFDTFLYSNLQEPNIRIVSHGYSILIQEILTR